MNIQRMLDDPPDLSGQVQLTHDYPKFSSSFSLIYQGRISDTQVCCLHQLWSRELSLA